MSNTLDIVKNMIEVLEMADQVKNSSNDVDLTILDKRLEKMKQQLLSDIDNRLKEIENE